MSHFSVLVVGPDIESQLAPYMENCCETPERKYLQFTDTETDMLEEYQNQTCERIVAADGKLLLPWDESFRVPGTIGTGSGTHEAPSHLERREVKFSTLYPTFEAFATDYHGSKERDPEKGRFGYWQNPNRKWDWFVIGGRYAAYFLLKPGNCGPTPNIPLNPFSEELTKQTLEHFAPKLDGRHVDQARKGEIDFETMRRREEESAAKTWDMISAVIAGTPECKSWEEVKESVGNIELAREIYHGQPRVAAFEAFKNSEKGRDEIGIFDQVESFTIPRQEYVEAARRGAITTFAVVMDSKWYARGEMGWWGMVHKEKDIQTWDSQFANLLDGLPDNTLLTIVDCHI